MPYGTHGKSKKPSRMKTVSGQERNNYAPPALTAAQGRDDQHLPQHLRSAAAVFHVDVHVRLVGLPAADGEIGDLDGVRVIAQPHPTMQEVKHVATN